MNIVRIFKDNSRLVKEFVTANSHTIKSAMAMVGVIGVGYTSHQAAKDAEERKKKATEEKGSELSKVETIVAVAPAYALPVAVSVITEALIFGANKDATNKIVAAGAVATMYKDQLKEFTDKAKEVVGENKVRDIKDAIGKDNLEKDPNMYRHPDDFDPTNSGVVCCWKEYLSGQKFYASYDKVALYIKEMEVSLKSGEDVALSEFYDKVGIGKYNPEGVGAGQYAYFDAQRSTTIHYYITSSNIGHLPCNLITFEGLDFRYVD